MRRFFASLARLVTFDVRDYVRRAKTYSDTRFVLEVSALTFAINIAWSLALFGVVSLYGYLVYGSLGLIEEVYPIAPITFGFVVGAVIIAPLLETLLGQWLPITIASAFTKRTPLIIAVATAVFVLPHIDPVHILSVVPVGIVLAGVFLLKKRESFPKAFWTTAAVHAMFNVFTILLQVSGM